MVVVVLWSLLQSLVSGQQQQQQQGRVFITAKWVGNGEILETGGVCTRDYACVANAQEGFRVICSGGACHHMKKRVQYAHVSCVESSNMWYEVLRSP